MGGSGSDEADSDRASAIDRDRAGDMDAGDMDNEPDTRLRVQDPGLQAERTRLAWARTSLAMAVVGALELHVGGSATSVVGRLPGALTMLLAAGCWAHGGRRYLRITRALAAGRSVADGGGLKLAALALIPAAVALWALLV